jgi:hypothetical protein
MHRAVVLLYPVVEVVVSVLHVPYSLSLADSDSLLVDLLFNSADLVVCCLVTLLCYELLELLA